MSGYKLVCSRKLLLYKDGSDIDLSNKWNRLNFQVPKWYPGNRDSYAAYRSKYSYRSTLNTGLLTRNIYQMSYRDERIRVGPETFLLSKCGNIMTTGKEMRWLSVVPTLQVSGDGLMVDKRIFDEFTMVTFEEGSYYIHPIDSLSHFLAESLPSLLLLAEKGLIRKLFYSRLSEWQKMLIELVCIYFDLPSPNAICCNPNSFRLLVSISNSSYIEDLSFYEGLTVTSTFLVEFVREYGIEWLVEFSKVKEPSRKTIAEHYDNIYLSRYFHENSNSARGVPRTSNMHEFARGAIDLGWFVLCPEKYTFWSIYRLLQRTRRIIMDNGSSQIHALVNAPLVDNISYLRNNCEVYALVQDSFYKEGWQYDTWMWYANFLGKPGFNIISGQTEERQIKIEPYLEPAVFDSRVFRTVRYA